ncbi:hypothetical protein HMN09_01395800 [Mycena chlorophos]|uniref:Uncharacterized protein n=1 Tax=Mycena chlorophos TaxID=658473 RepID=A0A8H6RXY6_MYCCL|nr:hypothetical protein HMN09_01395800 [Mycena chlorophos]
MHVPPLDQQPTPTPTPHPHGPPAGSPVTSFGLGLASSALGRVGPSFAALAERVLTRHRRGRADGRSRRRGSLLALPLGVAPCVVRRRISVSVQALPLNFMTPRTPPPRPAYPPALTHTSLNPCIGRTRGLAAATIRRDAVFGAHMHFQIRKVPSAPPLSPFLGNASPAHHAVSQDALGTLAAWFTRQSVVLVALLVSASGVVPLCDRC